MRNGTEGLPQALGEQLGALALIWRRRRDQVGALSLLSAQRRTFLFCRTTAALQVSYACFTGIQDFQMLVTRARSSGLRTPAGGVAGLSVFSLLYRRSTNMQCKHTGGGRTHEFGIAYTVGYLTF